MVWDNLQSTSIVKALPIIDDIGQILGVFMQKKGSNVGLEATVKAQFTCNEPEGGGAQFKPNIVDGVIDSVEVIKPGIGYGFDPADTFCPKEQYGVLVPKVGLQQHVNDGEYIEQNTTGNPDVLQVVDTNYNDDSMLLATINPDDNPNITVGLPLKTKSGHEFTLNFTSKFATLVIPQNAKALYAKCGDIIPKLDNVNVVNVGNNYKDPVITIGVGEKKKQIGTAITDSEGKIIKVNLTESVLGFVKPVIEDSQGTGAKLSVVYAYTSPRELKENNLLPLTQYIDCVGHPMIKSAIEDEENEFVDTGFNLVNSQVDDSTLLNTTDAVQSAPTVADPVSTPVNPSTPTETPSAPSTPSTPTPPSTPPAQNNPPQQGGYGGY